MVDAWEWGLRLVGVDLLEVLGRIVVVAARLVVVVKKPWQKLVQEWVR